MSEEQAVIAGRYQVGNLIGRGGMGHVYRGVDLYTGEIVAIKELHRHIVEENPDLVDRFKREGEALRQLDHPNIVNVMATIEHDNTHYLVMEYISGGSLRELIDEQGRLPVEVVLNVALDLADALTRAHRMNIIHRDIKPDNVLLAEDGTPRLTDFGVAHLGNRTRLTQTGSVIGTYAYLSPEACNGLDLDERTDIWSFGVLLYEALTGRLPFQETGTAAMLTAILTKSAPDINRLRPGLPPALVDLIDGMLVKERDHRISSIRLIGAELEAIIRGMDTPLRRLVFGEEIGTPGRSRFATPSDHDIGVPGMAHHDPDHTHGFSVYPTPSDAHPTRPPTGAPAPTPAGHMITPSGYIRPDGVYVTPSGELVPVRSGKWLWLTIMVSVIVLALAAIAVTWLATMDDDTPGLEANRSVPEDVIPAVEPVGPDEYMVLVAQLEPLGPVEREAGRFVADELIQTLEVGVPFSNVRVRRYPRIVTSQAEAQEAAAANDATVIIWGNFTPNTIELAVQIGETTAFPQMPVERQALEQAANVRVRMADERRESVATMVLGVLATLHAGDGNVYEYMRTLAMMDEVNVQDAQIVGDNVAAYVHRYFAAFNKDMPAAFEAIDGALAKDASNPLLYGLQGVALLHEARTDEAARAAETAARLGPFNWVVPLYLLANSTERTEDVLAYDARILTLRPDDWYAHSARGALYYVSGRQDAAREDLEAAIALEPNANFPYVYAALIAINEGRFETAAQYIKVILEDFPDPNLYSRIVGTTVGGHDDFGPLVTVFVNVSMGRYEQAIEAAKEGHERMGPVPDLFVLQGMAYCNLGNNRGAEAAYSTAIDVSRRISWQYTWFTHLLRGDVRLKMQNQDGSGEDFALVREARPDLDSLISGFEAGAIDCTNLFGSVTQGSDPALPGAVEGMSAPEGAGED